MVGSQGTDVSQNCFARRPKVTALSHLAAIGRSSLHLGRGTYPRATNLIGPRTVYVRDFMGLNLGASSVPDDAQNDRNMHLGIWTWVKIPYPQ